MNKTEYIYLGLAAVAGYFLATTLKSEPIGTQAYNLGYNFGHGQGFTMATPANGG